MELFLIIFSAGLALMLVYWVFLKIGWYTVLLIIAALWGFLNYVGNPPQRKLTSAEKDAQRKSSERAQEAFLAKKRVEISKLPAPLRQIQYGLNFHPKKTVLVLYFSAILIFLIFIVIIDPK